MPRLNFPARLGYGTAVLVQAETVRVIRDVDDDGVLMFRELLLQRGYRTKKHAKTPGPGDGRRWPGPAWPGAELDLDWEPGPRAYALSPTETATVRLRRLLQPEPPSGLIVGVTDRKEGVVVDKRLRDPGRTIRVLQVALVIPSGPARIVLVHPRDVQHAPKPRSRP